MSVTLRPQLNLRIALSALAAILAATGCWLIMAELARAHIQRLPIDPAAAAAAAAARPDTRWAAAIGGIRGDLMAEHAFTYADLLSERAAQGAGAQSPADEARMAVGQALRRAPYHAGVWLLAAGLGARFDWKNPSPALALQMSYFTGPNEFALAPLRLATAARANILADGDLQRLVRRDIRTILTSRHALKPALVAAYQSAGPDARRFLESAVADTDPTFVATMRAGG